MYMSLLDEGEGGKGSNFLLILQKKTILNISQMDGL